MAQQQLNNTPLELQDMWHLSDDEERTERKLPGEGLDIRWLTADTNYYQLLPTDFMMQQPENANVLLTIANTLRSVDGNYWSI